jgi:tetratricopeptide (TPR) repeat protein
MSTQIEVVPNDRQEPAVAGVKTRATRTLLFRVVVSLFGPFLFLGIVEAGLRFAGVGYPTDVTVPCTLRGQAANCYNLFFAAPFFPPGMIKTPQVYAIPAAKARNTYRIFVLGESAAMGDPDPAYGFSRYLEVMLRQKYPQENFEVINTGIVAINSHVLLKLASGLSQFQPDMFIVYAGNNEVVGPYGPGTTLTSSTLPLPLIRTSIFVRSLRLGQLAARTFGPKRQWRGMEMFLDKQVPANSPPMERVYKNFGTNLDAIIEVADKAGAQLVISTVVSNLRDCGPFASLHRPGLTQEALAKWTELLQKGIELESNEQYVEALKEYRSAEGIDDRYAELHFRIARLLWSTGDYSAAKEEFVRARDLDTLRFRSDTKINDTIRSVAKAHSSEVELVDSEAAAAAESLHGITGSEFLYEHVHLNPRGNYLLARILFPAVESRLPSQVRSGGASVDLPSEELCERSLALTRHDYVRIASQMAERMLRPPFTNRLNNSDELQKIYATIEAVSETSDETAAQYQTAIAARPDDRILHAKFGLFLFPYVPAAGVAQLELGRPWDGFPVLTPDGKPIE